VPIYPDENLLHQVFGLLAIANGSVNEVQEPGLIALDQLLKGTLFTAEKRGNDLTVVLRSELLSN
jgi:hypothetical protein